MVRGYVDAGNDIQSAEDIAKALKHGNGLLNTKVAVAEVSNQSPRLSYLAHSEVAGIKSFHSFQFFKTHMVAWKFYNVGSGVKLPYVGVEFKPSIKLVEEFQPCHHPNNITPLKKPECAINLLYFCPELNCAKIFDTQQELDAHCLSNEHDSVEAKSSLDKVKLSYMSRINKSVHETRKIFEDSTSHQSSSTADCHIFSLPSGMNFERGWGHHKRSNFRFSKRQKFVLWQIYITGEQSGVKMSAEQAFQHIRQTKKLKISEYVKPSQIKSLFSR